MTNLCSDLRLRSGETFVFVHLSKHEKGSVQRDRFCQLVQNRMNEYRPSAGRELAKRLERGERTPQQWLDQLRAARARDYREAGLADDRLGSLLQDPTADATAQRGGEAGP